MVGYGHAAMAFLALLFLLKFCLRFMGHKNPLVSNRPHIPSLSGKHVVITGGSSGIGLAIAVRCASEGAFLTLIARTPSKLSAAHRLLTSTLACPPDSILLKAVDVSDAEAIATAIEESFQWRPIDILMCCAGLGRGGLVDEVQVTEVELVTKTNFLGSVFPIRAALPLMKPRSLINPSSIVIMSSLSGLVLLYGGNMYTPTKYALKGLAELLRFELMPWNIHVNLVCPGFTETPLLDEVDNTAKDIKDTMTKLCFYNRKAAESAEEVAKRTMEGVKRGDFLISTTHGGFLIGALARGFIPADSITTFLIELLLIIPMRLTSFLWLVNTKRILHKQQAMKH